MFADPVLCCWWGILSFKVMECTIEHYRKGGYNVCKLSITLLKRVPSFKVLYCTVLHCIALYSTALHCSALYCTVQEECFALARNQSGLRHMSWEAVVGTFSLWYFRCLWLNPFFSRNWNMNPQRLLHSNFFPWSSSRCWILLQLSSPTKSW